MLGGEMRFCAASNAALAENVIRSSLPVVLSSSSATQARGDHRRYEIVAVLEPPLSRPPEWAAVSDSRLSIATQTPYISHAFRIMHKVWLVWMSWSGVRRYLNDWWSHILNFVVTDLAIHSQRWLCSIHRRRGKAVAVASLVSGQHGGPACTHRLRESAIFVSAGGKCSGSVSPSSWIVRRMTCPTCKCAAFTPSLVAICSWRSFSSICVARNILAASSVEAKWSLEILKSLPQRPALRRVCL